MTERRTPTFSSPLVRRQPRFAVCAAALLVSTAGFASGCGGDADASAKIAESRNTLEALAQGAPKSRALLASKYAEVISAITPASQSSDEEVAAFAQGLLAEALSGQGELAAATFRQADNEVLRALSAAAATLNLYIEQRALQVSLQGYTPDADIAAFEVMSVERRANLAKAKSDLTAAASQRDALISSASTLETESDGLRAIEGGVRERAASATAADRMPLVREAHDIRRKWELLLKDAEGLRAEASQFAPTIMAIELNILQAERQLASLEESKQEAASRAAWLRSASADAGRAAEDAAAAAVATMDALILAVSEGSRPAYDDASGKYSQALSKASGVRTSAARSGAQVSVGAIAHALGSVQREQAESLSRAVALLERAAAVQPPLAKSSDYAATAAQWKTDATSLLTEAASSYERAISAVGSMGGSEDISQRAQRISADLEALRRSITGEPEPAPEEPMSDDMPATDESHTDSDGMQLPDDEPAADDTAPERR